MGQFQWLIVSRRCSGGGGRDTAAVPVVAPVEAPWLVGGVVVRGQPPLLVPRAGARRTTLLSTFNGEVGHYSPLQEGGYARGS